jgi:hypothetical protein
VAVAEGTFAVILKFIFIWRVGRDSDEQVMPAACL